MIYLGIDPDLHHAGLCYLDSVKKEALFTVVRTPSSYRGEEANVELAQQLRQELLGWPPPLMLPQTVVVESQRIRPGSRVNPQDIVMLAQAAGVAAGVARSTEYVEEIVLVQPQDWKGTVKKEVFSAHLEAFFKPSCIADHPAKSHMLDALGLACWGWLRDRLPRSPSRDPSAPIRGTTVTTQLLSGLQPLSCSLVPKPDQKSAPPRKGRQPRSQP